MLKRLPKPRETEVIQSGFPLESIADDFYAACEKGWKDTFAMMRLFVEGNV